MLYTIWQIKRSFTNMLYLGFALTDVAKWINESQDVWAYLDKNRDKIKDYLNSLNTNKEWASIRTLDREDKISNLDNEALWKILVALGLDKTKIAGDWYYLSFLVNKINNFSYEKVKIQDAAQKDKKELKEDFEVNFVFVEWLRKWIENWEQVKKLQEILVKYWYLSETYRNKRGQEISSVDGDFGPGTDRALKKYQDSIWEKIDWVVSWETKKSLESLINVPRDENKVIKNKPEVKVDKSENIKTQEDFWEGKLTWTFWKVLDVKQMRNTVNLNSFNKLIKKLSFNEIKNLLKEANRVSMENNYDKDTKKYTFSIFSSEIKDVFKKVWYEADWAFGWEEIGAIFQLFENYKKTQEKIPKMSKKERIKMMFDYNMDGLLDNDVHFNVKEKAFFEGIFTKENTALTPETRLDNVLKNLWYANWMADFDKEISKNYVNARNDFKNSIVSRFWSTFGEEVWYSTPVVIEPAATIDDAKATEKVYEKMTELKNKVSKVAEKHKTTKGLSKYNQDKISETIVGLLYADWKLSVWLSKNISKYAGQIFDNATITVHDGMPWLAFSKNIKLWKNTTLVFWVVNAIIPFAWINHKALEKEIWPIKNLDQLDFKSGTEISVLGWVSVWGFSVWGRYENISKTTPKGIEKAVEKTEVFLDKVLLEDIKNLKDFSETWLDSKDKEIYERLKWLYISGWKTEMSLNQLKKWTLSNYKRLLVEQAQNSWFEITGGWLSLVFIAWYLPLPIAFIEWGRFSETKYAPVPTVRIDPRTGELVNSKNLKTGKYSEKTADKNVETVEVKDKDFTNGVAKIKDFISPRVRYNPEAQDLIDPNLSQSKRFKALWDLIKLAEDNLHKTTNEKYRWAGYIAKSNIRNIFEKSKWDDNKKLYLISALTQFIKSSFDAKKVKTIDDQKKLDAKRSKKFDKISGIDSTKYKKEYFSKLEKAKKVENWFVDGFSLDITSTIVDYKKGKPVVKKWMDGINGTQSVQIIDWKVAWVKISNADAQKLISKIKWLNLLTKEQKDLFINGIKDGSLSVIMYQDPIGFDDRFFFVEKWKKLEWYISDNIWANKEKVDYNEVVLWVGWDKEKKKEETKKTKTKPDDNKEGEIKGDWKKITDENNEQKVTPIEETTEPEVPIKTDENVNRPTPIPKPRPTPIEEDKSNWWRW